MSASFYNATLSAVSLGACANYAIIAGSIVTNVGLSIVNGDIAVSPGTSATGFYPPGVINGESGEMRICA